MVAHQTRYEFGNRPDAIKPTPRSSEHGTVIEEVGVFEQGSDKNYWKVIQRIKDGNSTITRHGYYVGKGDDWSWAQDALLLKTEIDNQLTARATTAGILTESSHE